MHCVYRVQGLNSIPPKMNPMSHIGIDEPEILTVLSSSQPSFLRLIPVVDEICRLDCSLVNRLLYCYVSHISDWSTLLIRTHSDLKRCVEL